MRRNWHYSHALAFFLRTRFLEAFKSLSNPASSSKSLGQNNERPSEIATYGFGGFRLSSLLKCTAAAHHHPGKKRDAGAYEEQPARRTHAPSHKAQLDVGREIRDQGEGALVGTT